MIYLAFIYEIFKNVFNKFLIAERLSLKREVEDFRFNPITLIKLLKC